VYSTVLSIKPDNAVKVILATLALHNFLRAKVPNRYIPKGQSIVKINLVEREMAVGELMIWQAT
jgi:hypothetical protein